MSSRYSVGKRGNVYYLRHRITVDKRLVQVSLRTGEQREAYRRAKQLVQEAELMVVLATSAPQREQEADHWHQAFLVADEEMQRQMARELVGGIERTRDKITEQRSQELQQEKEAVEAERLRQEKRLQQKALDLSNPRLDVFWALGSNKDDDKGLFVEWCQEGHRSRNTFIAYRTAWKRFRDYFPEMKRLGDITPETIKEFMKRCKRDTRRGQKPLSQSGITQYAVCLQGMFGTAIKEGWFKGENPVRLDWQEKRDRLARFLSRDEINALLTEAKALDTTTFLFIAVAVHTGMRKDEVAHLRWEEIDFKRKVITLQRKQADTARGIQEFQLKSKRARTVPLKKELAGLLQPYRKKEGYVIESRSGQDIKRTRWNLPSYFYRAQEKAGVKCNPHLLRHTFASWAAMEGVSIYKISEWLGHSSVQLTADTYAHLQAHDADIDRF